MPFAVCSEFVDDEEFYDNPSAWSVFEMENRNLSESANTQDFVTLDSSSSQAPLLQSFSTMVRTPQHHFHGTPKLTFLLLQHTLLQLHAQG